MDPDTSRSPIGTQHLPGLLVLWARKLGVSPNAGGEAAVGALWDAVQRRASRRFFIGGRRAPERDEDCADVAGDVMARLVASPESVLCAVAKSLSLDDPYVAPPRELASDAERIAASYIATMLYNRTVEVLRRRGLAIANPMSVEDIFDTLVRLPDSSDLEETYNNAERRALAERCRQELDDVALRVSRREPSVEGFLDTYHQLWRLAEEQVTMDELARATSTSKAALHQRHHRAREKLLKEIESSSAHKQLDPVMALTLTSVVTIYLRRRQTPAADGVSVVMASTKEPAR